jgi:hypothetical protein
MMSELITNHVSAIFLGILITLVLTRIIASAKKSRKEKLDPPFIFGPIRGMYVCYQCDTIFNSVRCPACNEEAIIPLIYLTGSISQDERVANVIRRLREPVVLKLSTFQKGQPIIAEPESRPEPLNGGVSEIPDGILSSWPKAEHELS